MFSLQQFFGKHLLLILLTIALGGAISIAAVPSLRGPVTDYIGENFGPKADVTGDSVISVSVFPNEVYPGDRITTSTYINVTSASKYNDLLGININTCSVKTLSVGFVATRLANLRSVEYNPKPSDPKTNDIERLTVPNITRVGFLGDGLDLRTGINGLNEDWFYRMTAETPNASKNRLYWTNLDEPGIPNGLYTVTSGSVPPCGSDEKITSGYCTRSVSADLGYRYIDSPYCPLTDPYKYKWANSHAGAKYKVMAYKLVLIPEKTVARVNDVVKIGIDSLNIKSDIKITSSGGHLSISSEENGFDTNNSSNQLIMNQLGDFYLTSDKPGKISVNIEGKDGQGVIRKASAEIDFTQLKPTIKPISYFRINKDNKEVEYNLTDPDPIKSDELLKQTIFKPKDKINFEASFEKVSRDEGDIVIELPLMVKKSFDGTNKAQLKFIKLLDNENNPRFVYDETNNELIWKYLKTDYVDNQLKKDQIISEKFQLQIADGEDLIFDEDALIKIQSRIIDNNQLDQAKWQTSNEVLLNIIPYAISHNFSTTSKEWLVDYDNLSDQIWVAKKNKSLISKAYAEDNPDQTPNGSNDTPKENEPSYSQATNETGKFEVNIEAIANVTNQTLVLNTDEPVKIEQITPKENAKGKGYEIGKVTISKEGTQVNWEIKNLDKGQKFKFAVNDIEQLIKVEDAKAALEKLKTELEDNNKSIIAAIEAENIKWNNFYITFNLPSELAYQPNNYISNQFSLLGNGIQNIFNKFINAKPVYANWNHQQAINEIHQLLQNAINNPANITTVTRRYNELLLVANYNVSSESTTKFNNYWSKAQIINNALATNSLTDEIVNNYNSTVRNTYSLPVLLLPIKIPNYLEYDLAENGVVKIANNRQSINPYYYSEPTGKYSFIFKIKAYDFNEAYANNFDKTKYYWKNKKINLSFNSSSDFLKDINKKSVIEDEIVNHNNNYQKNIVKEQFNAIKQQLNLSIALVLNSKKIISDNEAKIQQQINKFIRVIDDEANQTKGGFINGQMLFDMQSNMMNDYFITTQILEGTRQAELDNKFIKMKIGKNILPYLPIINQLSIEKNYKILSPIGIKLDEILTNQNNILAQQNVNYYKNNTDRILDIFSSFSKDRQMSYEIKSSDSEQTSQNSIISKAHAESANQQSDLTTVNIKSGPLVKMLPAYEVASNDLNKIKLLIPIELTNFNKDDKVSYTLKIDGKEETYIAKSNLEQNIEKIINRTSGMQKISVELVSDDITYQQIVESEKKVKPEINSPINISVGSVNGLNYVAPNKVKPGDIIAGTVEFTPFDDSITKGAKLRLTCNECVNKEVFEKEIEHDILAGTSYGSNFNFTINNAYDIGDLNISIKPEIVLTEEGQEKKIIDEDLILDINLLEAPEFMVCNDTEQSSSEGGVVAGASTSKLLAIDESLNEAASSNVCTPTSQYKGKIPITSNGNETAVGFTYSANKSSLQKIIDYKNKKNQYAGTAEIKVDVVGVEDDGTRSLIKSFKFATDLAEWVQKTGDKIKNMTKFFIKFPNYKNDNITITGENNIDLASGKYTLALYGGGDLSETTSFTTNLGASLSDKQQDYYFNLALMWGYPTNKDKQSAKSGFILPNGKVGDIEIIGYPKIIDELVEGPPITITLVPKQLPKPVIIPSEVTHVTKDDKGKITNEETVKWLTDEDKEKEENIKKENELYPGDKLKLQIEQVDTGIVPDNFNLVLPLPSFSKPIKVNGDYTTNGAKYDEKENTLTWEVNKDEFKDDNDKTKKLVKEIEIQLDDNIDLKEKTLNIKPYTIKDADSEKTKIEANPLKLDLWQWTKGNIRGPWHELPSAYINILDKNDKEIVHYYNYKDEDGVAKIRNSTLTDDNGNFKIKINRNIDLNELKKIEFIIKPCLVVSDDKDDLKSNILCVKVPDPANHDQLTPLELILDKKIDDSKLDQTINFNIDKNNDDWHNYIEPKDNKVNYKIALEVYYNLYHALAETKKIVKLTKPLNIGIDVTDPELSNGAYSIEDNTISLYGIVAGSLAIDKRRPDTEFHEFGHYLMDNFDGGYDAINKYIHDSFIQDSNGVSIAWVLNHRGFMNVNTSDSLKEGWADFYANYLKSKIFPELSTNITLPNGDVIAQEYNKFILPAFYDYYQRSLPNHSIEEEAFGVYLWNLINGSNKTSVGQDRSYDWLPNLGNISISYSPKIIEDIIKIMQSKPLNVYDFYSNYLKLYPGDKSKIGQGISNFDLLTMLFGFAPLKNNFTIDTSINNVGSTSNEALGSYPARPLRKIELNPNSYIKIMSDEAINASININNKVIFEDTYNYMNTEYQSYLAQNRLMYLSPNLAVKSKTYITLPNSSDYLAIDNQKYWEAVDATNTNNTGVGYVAETNFNIQTADLEKGIKAAVPPTIEEMQAMEAEKERVKQEEIDKAFAAKRAQEEADRLAAEIAQKQKDLEAQKEAEAKAALQAELARITKEKAEAEERARIAEETRQKELQDLKLAQEAELAAKQALFEKEQAQAREISRLEMEKKQLIEEQAKLAKQLADEQEKANQYKQQRDQALAKVKELEDQLNAAKSTKDQLTKDKENITNELNKAKEDNNILKVASLSLQSTINSLKEQINSYQSDNFQENIDKRNAEAQVLKTALDLALAKLENADMITQKDNLVKLNNDLSNKISDLTNTQRDQIKSIDAMNNDLIDLQDKLSSTNDTIVELTQQKYDLSNKLTQAQLDNKTLTEINIKLQQTANNLQIKYYEAKKARELKEQELLAEKVKNEQLALANQKQAQELAEMQLKLQEEELNKVNQDIITLADNHQEKNNIISNDVADQISKIEEKIDNAQKERDQIKEEVNDTISKVPLITLEPIKTKGDQLITDATTQKDLEKISNQTQRSAITLDIVKHEANRVQGISTTTTSLETLKIAAGEQLIIKTDNFANADKIAAYISNKNGEKKIAETPIITPQTDLKVTIPKDTDLGPKTITVKAIDKDGNLLGNQAQQEIKINQNDIWNTNNLGYGIGSILIVMIGFATVKLLVGKHVLLG